MKYLRAIKGFIRTDQLRNRVFEMSWVFYLYMKMTQNMKIDVKHICKGRCRLSFQRPEQTILLIHEVIIMMQILLSLFQIWLIARLNAFKSADKN